MTRAQNPRPYLTYAALALIAFTAILAAAWRATEEPLPFEAWSPRSAEKVEDLAFVPALRGRDLIDRTGPEGASEDDLTPRVR